MKRIHLLILSIIFTITSNAQEIQKSIDSVNIVLRKAKNPVERMQNTDKLGELYLEVNLDSALNFFRSANNSSLKLKDDQGIFRSYIGLGKVYSRMVKRDSAQVFFDLAEARIKNIDDYDLKTTLWINQGILYFYNSDYEKAKEKFETTLELAKIENNMEDISRCLNNIALCYDYTGQYAKSLEMHIQSAELAKSLDDSMGLAQSYNNMGLVYFNLEDYDKSEEYLLKSLEIKERGGNLTGVIGAYLNLGNSFRKVGVAEKDKQKLKKAQNYYQQALEKSEETGYTIGKISAYSSLALIETTLDNYDKGIEYGRNAVRLSMEAGDSRSEMLSRINLGDTYRYKRQYDLAEIELDKGLEIANVQNDMYIKKEIYLMRTRLYEAKRDFEKAFENYETYIQIKDSISSTDVKNKVNELETKFNVAQKEIDLAESRANLAESELKVKRRSNLVYGSLGLAVLLGLLGYLFYNQQKLKNHQLKKEGELKTALAKIETQNKLQEQRLRISRDLHDNIGSQLTFIASSIDNLKYGLDSNKTISSEKLTRISEFTRHTIYELRDTIWAMNKTQINLEDLQVRIANFIEQAKKSTDRTNFVFDTNNLQNNKMKLTSLQGMNLYRIIQEAVNNALKYAEAHNIEVIFSEEQQRLKVEIIDDGKGYDINNFEEGNGYVNMRKRAKDLNGEITFLSEEGNGTRVTLLL